VIANASSFAPGEKAYLYVFDEKGEVNRHGFPVTVDGGLRGASVGEVANAVPALDATDPRFFKNIFNPLNGESVNLRCALERAGRVLLTVFDQTGERVRELGGETQPPGTHVFSWDGRNSNGSVVSSGLYLVLQTVDDRPIGRSKVVVLK
jgi:hypothetical protein